MTYLNYKKKNQKTNQIKIEKRKKEKEKDHKIILFSNKTSRKLINK